MCDGHMWCYFYKGSYGHGSHFEMFALNYNTNNENKEIQN